MLLIFRICGHPMGMSCLQWAVRPRLGAVVRTEWRAAWEVSVRTRQTSDRPLTRSWIPLTGRMLAVPVILSFLIHVRSDNGWTLISITNLVSLSEREKYNLEEVRSYVSDSSDSCYSSMAAHSSAVNNPPRYIFIWPSTKTRQPIQSLLIRWSNGSCEDGVDGDGWFGYWFGKFPRLEASRASLFDFHQQQPGRSTQEGVLSRQQRTPYWTPKTIPKNLTTCDSQSTITRICIAFWWFSRFFSRIVRTYFH